MDLKKRKKEIEDELSDLFLPKTPLKVVRDYSICVNGIRNLHPVIAVYNFEDIRLILTPLEQLYKKSDYSRLAWNILENQRKEDLQRYNKFEPFFEDSTVRKILQEIQEY